MDAAAVVNVLQDEVERILRRLTLEETRDVALHLQINVDDNATKRDILRDIQDAFDNAADDDARNGLLRGLPIPEAHGADYQRLVEPPVHDDGDGHQVVPPGPQIVPNAGVEGVAAAVARDQVVPPGGQQQVNNGLQQIQQNDAVLVQNPGADRRQLMQQPVGVGQNVAANLGGVNLGGLQQNIGEILAQPNVGGVHQNLGGNFQFGGGNMAGMRPNMLNFGGGGFRQQNMQNVGGIPHVAGVVQQQLAGGAAMANLGQANRNMNAVAANIGYPRNNAVPLPNVNMGDQNAANMGPQNPGGLPQNAQLQGQNIQLPLLNLPQQNFPQAQRLVQMFPREFRMTGNISDDIAKSIKYLDICRQVADGRRKGYSDDEILSGLRRVVTTGAVKTYIDSQTNAPLEEILLFLRSFLKERTPTELYNDLTQLAQKEGQLAIQFFMDAIQIRQLIVVGSQVEGNVSYDPALVNATFIHTIRTGLRDEAVRAHMLPLLSDVNPADDNTLIREIHRAVGEAEERLKKLQEIQQQKKTPAKVNVVETSPELALVMKKLEESQAQMKENQNQMKVMQEQLAELMLKETRKKNVPWKKSACENCTKSNKPASSCFHCWKCFETGHKSQDCPKGN